MAYNNYFPNYQGYYPQYQNTFQQPLQQIQQPQQPQIQNGGLVSVRNIQEALNYPIAPGNSVMFKDENSPFIYVKTRGFSQLDEPIFEKYRLVKEEDMQAVQNQPVRAENNQTANMIDYALKTDLAALQEEIDALKQRIEELTVKKPVTKTKKESDAE